MDKQNRNVEYYTHRDNFSECIVYKKLQGEMKPEELNDPVGWETMAQIIVQLREQCGTTHLTDWYELASKMLALRARDRVPYEAFVKLTHDLMVFSCRLLLEVEALVGVEASQKQAWVKQPTRKAIVGTN